MGAPRLRRRAVNAGGSHCARAGREHVRRCRLRVTPGGRARGQACLKGHSAHEGEKRLPLCRGEAASVGPRNDRWAVLPDFGERVGTYGWLLQEALHAHMYSLVCFSRPLGLPSSLSRVL